MPCACSNRNTLARSKFTVPPMAFTDVSCLASSSAILGCAGPVRTGVSRSGSAEREARQLVGLEPVYGSLP
jgi:hypothetical protein